jgi:hypothetical protein
MRSLSLWTTTLVWAVGCAEQSLPPLVASSKYIDYHTDADPSVLCMDDFLAREDRFVEEVAEMLGVDVPTGRISFVWNPYMESGESWACKHSVDCYRYDEGQGTGLIVSRNVWNRHELVHAVEIPALGAEGSKVLGEGLAEYLGSGKSTAGVVDGFPAAFEAMVEDGEVDYLLAQHFVGALFLRDGAEKYRAFRQALSASAGAQQFSSTFEAIYGRAWSEALAEMNEPVHGLVQPLGCGDGNELEWTADGILDTTIASQCGDGSFFGPGTVHGRPAFEATFIVQIAEAGAYDFTVRGAGVEGILNACSFEIKSQSIGSNGGQTIQGLLYPGEHVLLLRFPAADEPRGEASVTIEYVGPPP